MHILFMFYSELIVLTYNYTNFAHRIDAIYKYVSTYVMNISADAVIVDIFCFLMLSLHFLAAVYLQSIFYENIYVDHLTNELSKKCAVRFCMTNLIWHNLKIRFDART